MHKNNNIIVIVVVLFLVIILGFLLFNNSSEEEVLEKGTEREEIEEEENNDVDQEEETSFEEELKEVIEGFLGLPYKRGALDEETLYTEEGFDSTTLVLSSVARVHNKENPEEEMKKINYYPKEEVSYENRLHFSTYRNKVSDYFKDITEQVSEDNAKSKVVVLNKENKEGDRLIDIEWEKEIEFFYIPKEYMESVSENLPLVSGVMFVFEGDEDIGLDVRGEGIVTEGMNFIYASGEEGEVIKVDFLDYIEELDPEGVVFYSFLEVE